MTAPDSPPRPSRTRRPRAEPSPQRLDAVKTGRRGEAVAQRLAEERGWQVWGRNVQVGRNEADLVCVRRDDHGLRGLLVEVKTSKTLGRTGRIDEAFAQRLGPRQLAGLWRTAAALHEQLGLNGIEVVLVLVGITADREHAIWMDLEPF